MRAIAVFSGKIDRSTGETRAVEDMRKEGDPQVENLGFLVMV